MPGTMLPLCLPGRRPKRRSISVRHIRVPPLRPTSRTDGPLPSAVPPLRPLRAAPPPGVPGRSEEKAGGASDAGPDCLRGLPPEGTLFSGGPAAAPAVAHPGQFLFVDAYELDEEFERMGRTVDGRILLFPQEETLLVVSSIRVCS